jgi:hypothetical protein
VPDYARGAAIRAARTRRELRGQTRYVWAPEVDWDEHAQELSSVWEPGQHVAIIAPTDWGKTHLVLKGLEPLWPKEFPWALFDVKGRDPILSGWGHAGRKLPPRVVRHRMYDDQRYRIVPPHAVDDTDAARSAVMAALRTVWRECGGKPGQEDFRGWVVHVNEAAALAGNRPPDLNLEAWLKWLYQRGRPHLTVIGETQRPAQVPRAMYDQASHVYMGGPVDDQAVKRLAEIGGDTDNIVRIIHYLQEPQFLYFRRRGRLMQIVTAPA